MNVRTVLSSGNVVFDARAASDAYVPSPRGAAFMTLIEKAFGKDVTTRTWGTVARCARS